MLQDKSLGSPTITEGFLIAVEVDPEVITPEEIKNKLGDSLAWTEGVGFIDVSHMGQIETYPSEIVTYVVSDEGKV